MPNESLENAVPLGVINEWLKLLLTGRAIDASSLEFVKLGRGEDNNGEYEFRLNNPGKNRVIINSRNVKIGEGPGLDIIHDAGLARNAFLTYLQDIQDTELKDYRIS